MTLVFKTKTASLLVGNFLRTNHFLCAVAFRITSFVSTVSHAGSRWKGEHPADVENRKECVTESRDLRKNLTTVEKENIEIGGLRQRSPLNINLENSNRVAGHREGVYSLPWCSLCLCLPEAQEPRMSVFLSLCSKLYTLCMADADPPQ